MLIAHLSDLHLFTHHCETGESPAHIAHLVEAIVEDLCALEPLPDAVIISGDLADGGTPEDYQRLRELLEPLPMPVLAVPGNHDQRTAMREGLGERLAGLRDGAFLNSRLELPGVTLLGLDSVVPGEPQGALCSERLAWLAGELRDTQTLTFIAMHHPPLVTGNRYWDPFNLIEGKERLAELLGDSPKRLLCGHIHQPFHAQWGAHYVGIAGSPAFEYHARPKSRDRPAPAAVPYSYPLHHIGADRSVSVYRRHLFSRT